MMMIPLLTLSIKLIDPYTNAPPSTFDPIRSAVIDREVISSVDPPIPRSVATMYIPHCLYSSSPPTPTQMQPLRPNAHPKMNVPWGCQKKY